MVGTFTVQAGVLDPMAATALQEQNARLSPARGG